MSAPWMWMRLWGCAVSAAERLQEKLCWGEETRGYVQAGSFLICSVAPMGAVLAQWGQLRAGTGGQCMGEGLASAVQDSQCVICWGVVGGSGAHIWAVHSQHLSFLYSGVQMDLFPVTWSGVNCAETRKWDEESSGAIGVCCTWFGLQVVGLFYWFSFKSSKSSVCASAQNPPRCAGLHPHSVSSSGRGSCPTLGCRKDLSTDSLDSKS